MILPGSDAIRWFVEYFRQLSLSVEYMKTLSEAKQLECAELRTCIAELEKQAANLVAFQSTQDHILAEQRFVIQALSHKRDNAGQEVATVDATVASTRPRTPWPSEVASDYDSESVSSRLSMDSPATKRVRTTGSSRTGL